MSKPRILFVLHLPPPVHGASVMGQYIHDSAYINAAFDCHYVNMTTARTLKDIGKGSWQKYISYIRLLFKIRKTIRQYRPDLVYVTPNTTGGPFYKDYVIVMLCRLLCQHVVLHFHNKGVQTRQHRWLDDKLYRSYFSHQPVILLSELLYNDVSRYVTRNDCFILPNGIADRTASVQLPHHAAHQPLRLLFFSNMMAEKGVWTLLGALSVLKERSRDFVCHFVGGWKDITEQDFRHAVDIRGLGDRVFAHGPKYGNDKEVYWTESDLFVFPSNNECFPLVLLEAMQHALPCISTNEGGIPDIIEDGKTGFIVPCKDATALADAVDLFIADPTICASMGEAGRAKYQNEFTLPIFEHNFVETIQNVLNQSHI